MRPRELTMRGFRSYQDAVLGVSGPALQAAQSGIANVTVITNASTC